MILPAQNWEKWNPMRDRSLTWHRESYVQVSLEFNFDFDPEQIEADFTLHENAFLNATAKAFGITRADVEAGCANGAIEWRNECPGRFQARCAGYQVNLPICWRRWNETHREWMAKITEMAKGTGRIYTAV